jgi:hypothetical protein
MPRISAHEVLAVTLSSMPISIRSLARRAGVSHVLLLKVRDGEARLTPDVAARLIGALREVSVEMAGLADRLEAATREDRDKGGQ